MGPRRRLISTYLMAAAAAGGLAAPRRGAALAQAQPAPADRVDPAPAANAGTAPAAAQRAAAPATSPTAPGRADVGGDLRRLADTLKNPAARPADRDDAAARLVSRQSAEADAILREILETDGQVGRIAVCRALSDDLMPRQELVDPLAGLLSGGEQRSAALAEAAATALASYRRNSAALGHLIGAASDADQLPLIRAAAARAMGRVIESAAAQTLVQLASAAAAAEPKEVRDAAADALIEMTGLAENGHDGRRWAQWLQQENPANNPDAWRADLLDRRAARLDSVRRRYESLVADTKARLFAQYQAAADSREKRQAVLLELLSSSEPEVRLIGNEFVKLAMQEQGVEDISDAVRDRLVAMVGDGDPQVRLRTAETLRNMNYAGALGALLTQLAQERDEQVKIALAGAVAPINDPAVAPALLDLLNNARSPAVTMAAVRGLVEAGRDLRASDPVLADRIAARLRTIVLRPRNPQANEDLRVAALDALAPLRDPSVLEMDLRGTLLKDPSPAIRQGTLRVLGDLGNDKAAPIILDTLQAERRDPTTRKVALDALAKTGGLVYYQKFYDYMQPQTEADPEVRQAAWDAMRAALPQGTDMQLANAQKLFQNDPEHRVVVTQVLTERLRQREKLEDWAMQMENLAEDELKLKSPRWSDAAGHFEEALKHWLRHGGAALTIDSLTRKVVEARLAARQYALVASFAQAAIQERGAAAQEVVGPIIKNEADRLRTIRDYRNAQTLIDAALKMKPGLDERHQQDIRQVRADIEAAAPGGGGDNAPAPNQ